MTPERIAGKIARVGQTVTLKRVGVADLSLPAVVRHYDPEELVGGIMQGDREVRIGAAAPQLTAANWPVPPKKPDQIVIKGSTTTVQAAETLTVADADVEFLIRVRGG